MTSILLREGPQPRIKGSSNYVSPSSALIGQKRGGSNPWIPLLDPALQVFKTIALITRIKQSIVWLLVINGLL